MRDRAVVFDLRVGAGLVNVAFSTGTGLCSNPMSDYITY